MARSTAMTTQTEIESTTVTAEIYHGEIGSDATADVRCFGLDELTQDVFDEHYESLGELVEIEAGETVIETLEDVWKRTQGGRIDDELPYDGSQVRSSMVGDVVVLDGVPFAAADVGFERVEIDVDGVNETAVFVHRDATSDDAVSDFIFCTFDDDVAERLEAPGDGLIGGLEWIEAQVMAEYETEDEELDELVVDENEREDDPIEVGRLTYLVETGQIVELDLEADPFDEPELVADGGPPFSEDDIMVRRARLEPGTGDDDVDEDDRISVDEAEIQAEAEQLDRYERHVDRRGHF